MFRLGTTSVLSFVTVLAVLTGCGSGGGGAESAAAPSADSQNQQRQRQAGLATCMKGKGFTYHPIVSQPELPEEMKQESSGDYEAMKKYRGKYGFGFAASFVYPNETGGRVAVRAVAGGGSNSGDPNDKVIAGLSETQREAYFDAMSACMLEQINKATGRKLTSMEELGKAQSEMLKQAINRELDGDAQLVELAGAFGDCLKGKGYQVTSQRPSEISRSTEQPFMEELGKFGAKTPTPDEARPMLTREIKAALDDLECGKNFYPVYRPKANTVHQQVADLYGGMGLIVTTATKG
ncbi:hypothetical protein [Acrocarpospora catenulata]|uniref:hypothetical protein n=1 Tax=Acrocarpospora catenulata TaxID=2836182 RepID=UPI001BDA7CBD|nr:hypothetical protein [Acrocarpospora catenulata]